VTKRQWQSRQAIKPRPAALLLNAGILPSMVRKSWSFKDDRRVTELARASKTLEQIAKASSPERIRKVAIRLGVSIKSRTPKEKYSGRRLPELVCREETASVSAAIYALRDKELAH
jgi:hypothetical protein